jgi:L-threonylcarbamoyladenylate synthase
LDLNVGFLLFKNESPALPSTKYVQLSNTKNLIEAASNLYSAMHELDRMNFDVIYAEKLPDKGLGVTINDRFYRAQEENFEFKI